jgi:signal transduction histidine kinase
MRPFAPTLFNQLLHLQLEISRSRADFSALLSLLAQQVRQFADADSVVIQLTPPAAIAAGSATFFAGESSVARPANSIFSFPLKNETKIIGTLQLSAQRENAFSDSIPGAVQLLAGFFCTPFTKAARPAPAILSQQRHEVLNNLSGIVGLADLLLESELNEEQRDFLSRMKTAGDETLTLVREIFQSMKEEVAPPYSISEFTLDLLFLNLERTTSFTFQQKGLSFFYQLSPELAQFQFQGDADELSHALLQLINQSAQFTDQGHVAIAVTGESISGNVLQLNFEIIDTGRATPPENLQARQQVVTQLGAELKFTGNPGYGNRVSFSIAFRFEEKKQPKAA